MSKSIRCQWTQDNLGGGGWRSQWVQCISINNQLNHPPDPMSSPNAPAIHLSWLAVILKSAIHRLVGRMLPATAGFWNLHTQPRWSGSNTVGGESPRLHVVSSLLFSLFRPAQKLASQSMALYHPSIHPPHQSPMFLVSSGRLLCPFLASNFKRKTLAYIPFHNRTSLWHIPCHKRTFNCLAHCMVQKT